MDSTTTPHTQDPTPQDPGLQNTRLQNTGQAPQPVVLCVDDEQSILTSLKRALRKQPYQLLIANSGQEALDIMAGRGIDLIISDMRMPNMDGAELLGNVFNRWPNTLRILLTGYSDMESTVAAINKAQIYRYISKPWNNDELVVTINSALEHKKLRDEHAVLTALTQKQNSELVDLNENLETKVKARTLEIAKATKLLNKSFAQLKESYKHSISVFSQLIELREGRSSLHGQHVATLSEAIGKALNLDDDALSDLANAALLHDIGKLGFSDELSTTPYNRLDKEQQEHYQSHPRIGQAALLSINALDKTGIIIRSHHEYYNGKGFPDGLSGEDIPLGARILAVASDFDDLQNGIFLGDQLSQAEAVAYIKNQVNNRYDPQVVNVFCRVINALSGQTRTLKEMKVNHQDLVPGLVVTRDITADNGMLLLRKGQQLNESLIQRIQLCLEDDSGSRIIYVAGNTQTPPSDH